MEFFQEIFVTVLLGLVFSCIIVKLVSFALSSDEKIDRGNRAVEEVKCNKGLVVEKTKSKKRVTFAEYAVIKNDDQYERQRPDEDERGINDGEGTKSSEISELLDNSVEEVVFEEKGEDGTIEKRVNGVQVRELNETAEWAISRNELVEKDSEIRDISFGDAGEGASNSIGSQDECLEKDVVEEKEKDNMIDEFSAATGEGALTTELLEGMVVEENAKNREMYSENGRKLNLDGDGLIDQNGGGPLRVNEREEVTGKEGDLGNGEGEKEGIVSNQEFDNDDDDWEGIERSDLEKVFAEAVNFVEYRGKGEDIELQKLGTDVQMQLYGLHRLAMEGPCHEPQPMALKISARAKWNAWQKLGSMTPDIAMEQYIKLLSDSLPGWTRYYSAEESEQAPFDTGAADNPDVKSRTLQDIQAEVTEERSEDELKTGLA